MLDMKIDVNRNDEIEHWARRFGVTRARLIAAVAATGPEAGRVEAWLVQRKPREQDTGQAAAPTLAAHTYE